MGWIILIIIIIAAIYSLVKYFIENVSGHFFLWAVVIFFVLKFLFQWLPKIIDNSRIEHKEDELNQLPKKMENEIKELEREFQYKSEIILKNPDIAKKRIAELTAHNAIKRTKTKRAKPINKYKLINLSLIGLILGYVTSIFLNANYNPLAGIKFYSPIIVILWFGLTFLSLGISFLQVNKAMKIAYRIVSFGILLLGSIWFINLFMSYKSINSYKYDYYARDFFNTTNENYYKIIKPNSFIYYDKSKCDLINTTQQGDMFNVSSKFQIWQQKTYNNVVGSPKGFEQAQGYYSKNRLFCTNFKINEIDNFINSPLSITFYAKNSKSGKNNRFGFFLLNHLFLFDSKKVYMIEDLHQNSSFWVFLGNPIKGKSSYKPNQIYPYNFGAVRAINYSSSKSYSVNNWKNSKNKIDIVFSKKHLIIKINDLMIFRKAINFNFWNTKDLKKKLFIVFEKNSDFSLSPLQIAKLNPETDSDFFIGKSIPLINQIRENPKAINIYGFATSYSRLSTKKLTMTIPKNERISILNENGSILYVQYKDKVGNCENSKITSIYSENSYSLSKSKLGIILGNPTNLRSSPSAGSKIITKLNKNEIVEIVSKSGNWYSIKHNGKKGYIYKTLIKRINASSLQKKQSSSIQFDKKQRKQADNTTAESLLKDDSLIVELNLIRERRKQAENELKEIRELLDDKNEGK